MSGPHSGLLDRFPNLSNKPRGQVGKPVLRASTRTSLSTDDTMTPTRRDFVRAALAAPLFAAGLRADESARPGFPGLVVRAHEPRNLEFPLSELKDPIVPNEQFFVRNHFAVPEIDVKAWRLKIEG